MIVAQRSATKDPEGGNRINTTTTGPKMDGVGKGGNIRDRTQYQSNREERGSHNDGDQMDWIGGSTTEHKP